MTQHPNTYDPALQLAINIGEARERAGMTIRDLARVTGRNKDALNRMETNGQKVTVIDLMAIAQATNTPVHTLIPVQL